VVIVVNRPRFGGRSVHVR